MSDSPTNIRFTWQLVSQFVSWEFCRYMSENNENSISETDVLSFLRNMIVQRTEQPVSDVTKHEIIAKFIMEIKAINNFQVLSIIPLFESVKKICPELDSAVNKLVHHLETFFKVLESTDERRKALIQLRIKDAISDFSKEANRLLPKPDLLQVVDSWNGMHHHHNHLQNKADKKSIYNTELYENVLECLHYERILPSEARLIAVSLNEDKVFEKILQNAETEPETEADSEQFTLSQSSQPVYSQEFVKNTQIAIPGINPLTQEPPILHAYTQVPSSKSPVQTSYKCPEMPNNESLEQNEDDPAIFAGTPPSPPPSPPEYPFTQKNISSKNGNAQLQKLSSSCMQFAQSSANESDEGDADLHDRLDAKLQQLFHFQKRQNESDSDTSDCDKNANFRFLTPTYFKKGAKSQVIYVSDVESNDSSIISNVPSSQQEDPNWSRRQLSLPATQYVKPNKRKNLSPKNGKIKKKEPVRRIYSSSDSDENPINTASNMPLKSPHHPSTSVTRTRAELGGPLKKRKMSKALYRSPTLCIDDFVSVLRKPNSESTLSEVSVPNLRKAKKTAAQFDSNTLKKQKCQQCNKTYKTTIALRRHVFLKHTEPPEDSDCDT